MWIRGAIGSWVVATCAGFLFAQESLRLSEVCEDAPAGAAASSAFLTSARVDPICIRAGVDSFRLSIGVVDPQIVSVSFPSQGRFLYQGAPVSTLTLLDDGTQGDLQAGDGVFSLDQLSLAQATGTIGSSVLRMVNLTFRYDDAHEEVSSEDLGLTLHYVSPSVPIPQAISLAPDVRASGFAVNIVQPLQGSFPGHFVDNKAVARRYYELLPDDRDFLLLAKPFNTTGSAASFITVRNDVQGIGLDLLDLSAEFGSAGFLQGVVNLYFGNVLPATLNHELLHRWAAFLDPSLHFTGSGAHWGAISAGGSGFGGPLPYAGSFDVIEPVSGNLYLGMVQSSGAYSPLELYLMGLADLGEVPSPIAALVNPVFQQYDGFGHAIYAADELLQVPTAQIVAVEGARNPGHLTSQKQFRSALVVVYDRPLSDVELAYYDFAMREYQKPTSPLGVTFIQATGARATLSTCLGASCASIPAVDGLGLMIMVICLLGAGILVVSRRRERDDAIDAD